MAVNAPMATTRSLVAGRQCTVAVFDGLSSAYESPRNRAFYAHTAELMARRALDLGNIGVGGCCLDLACGTGISTEAALAMLPHVRWFGLDVSAEMLRVAKAKQVLRPVRFVHSSAEQAPFPDQMFHWILCNIAYHWLEPSALDEIKRLLKPGGRLSLMVPLVSPSGDGSGNRWLGSILMRFSQIIVSRRSQGLTLPALKWELKDFHLDHAEMIEIDEDFASSRELLDVLDSRSSLSAIFGEHAEEVKNQLIAKDLPAAAPLRFRWKVAFVEARIG